MSFSESFHSPKSRKSLIEYCPLDEKHAISIFSQLLDKVAMLHAAGRWHGQILAEDVLVADDLQVELMIPSAANIGTGSRPPPQSYPPFLPNDQDWPFTGEITHDHNLLHLSGVAADPQQIDLYQLGALLCKLLTGTDVAMYLQSPRVQSKIRPAIRHLIDHSIGLGTNSPYTTVCDLKEGIATATEDQPLLSVEGPTVRFGTAGSAETVVENLTVGTRRMPLADHSALGPYTIVRRVGSGGMGDVYKALEPRLERFVAIKVLPPELASQRDLVERFRAEAMAIAKFTHPNIVQIYSIGQDNGHHYFVMQYVDGESLADRLARRSRLSVEETLQIARGCLAGLIAAHQRQLIHRDIKPGNILLDREDGRPLLADFGLAKSLTQDMSLTATGIVMGTAGYLAPEQGLGKSVDHRADLYSMGILIYRLLSGRLPFDAESPTGVIFKHAYEQAPPLWSFVPEVSQRLSDVVARLMAKNPDERFQSATELMRTLDRLDDQVDLPFPGDEPVENKGEQLLAGASMPKPSEAFLAAGLKGSSSTPQSLVLGQSAAKAFADGHVNAKSSDFRRTKMVAKIAAAGGAGVILAFGLWVTLAHLSPIEKSTKTSQAPKQNSAATQIFPTDAVEFDGQYYKLIEKMRISWSDAKAACELAGGHLACPNTLEKAEFVAKLKKQQAVWVGAYREPENLDGGWKWISGESLDARLVLFPGSPGHLWMATSADEKQAGFVPRTIDGTIRDKDGNVVAGRNTNIHGYICEWDK
jgi:serine/threonine protein kinase